MSIHILKFGWFYQTLLTWNTFFSTEVPCEKHTYQGWKFKCQTWQKSVKMSLRCLFIFLGITAATVVTAQGGSLTKSSFCHHLSKKMIKEKLQSITASMHSRIVMPCKEYRVQWFANHLISMIDDNVSNRKRFSKFCAGKKQRNIDESEMFDKRTWLPSSVMLKTCGV